MIFIILGSQKFQFNRLLEAIDDLKKKGKIKEDIIAQVGYSDYIPNTFQIIDFIEKENFESYIEKADIVICHGGTGAIITALKKNKKVIAIPRDSKYGEHVDDHQKQIVSMFSELNLIEACFDVADLEDIIKIIHHKNYESFKSNNYVFVSELRKDIEKIAKK